MDDQTLLLAVIPLVIIQIGLQVFALYDIYRHGGAKNPTWLWVLIVVLGQLIGPILYFVLGRKEDY